MKILLPLPVAAFTIWQQSVPPPHFNLYFKNTITHTLHIEYVLQWLVSSPLPIFSTENQVSA